jgi:diaminobutyrate-2-oxoglutarate transaminase
VLSKAIGGSLPLSVIVYRTSLDTWEPGAHAGTFRGNQLAMAAGTATLRHIRCERLDRHAAQIGLHLQASLRQLKARYPELGDVRGRGLMLGVEFVDPDGEPDASGNAPPAPALAKAVQAACLRYGMIVELGGRDGAVLRLLPPLIITQKEADHVFEILAAAVRTAVGQYREESSKVGPAARPVSVEQAALVCK